MFALIYWTYLERRTQLEDRQEEMEAQTFNLFPERWSQLYRDKAMAEVGMDDEIGEQPVTDTEALDQWYEQMVARGGLQVATGAMVRDQEWGDWQ